jgi:hypothetical protein
VRSGPGAARTTGTNMLRVAGGGKGCLLRNVKGTFIGMSESRKGITSGAETATNVPCDSRNNRRTIRPATNILNPPSDSVGTPGTPENPPPPSPSSTWRRRGREGDPPKNKGCYQNPKGPEIHGLDPKLHHLRTLMQLCICAYVCH